MSGSHRGHRLAGVQNRSDIRARTDHPQFPVRHAELDLRVVRRWRLYGGDNDLWATLRPLDGRHPQVSGTGQIGVAAVVESKPQTGAGPSQRQGAGARAGVDAIGDRICRPLAEPGHACVGRRDHLVPCRTNTARSRCAGKLLVATATGTAPVDQYRHRSGEQQDVAQMKYGGAGQMPPETDRTARPACGDRGSRQHLARGTDAVGPRECRRDPGRSGHRHAHNQGHVEAEDKTGDEQGCNRSQQDGDINEISGHPRTVGGGDSTRNQGLTRRPRYCATPGDEHLLPTFGTAGGRGRDLGSAAAAAERNRFEISGRAGHLRFPAPASTSIHQPRSASRWGCGMSSTLIPTIASPSPRDTFASTSGSS